MAGSLGWVRRARAASYLRNTLVSFGLTVMATRLFLEITGYPRLGTAGIHIAHVLWGGLLLFVAALLPLLFMRRRALLWSSILAGAGVGLFIDEVGKLITANNDYFHPAAAPIVYAFFLLTALTYAQFRRSAPRDAKTELYQALEGLEEVLERDLNPDEERQLRERLAWVVEHAESPERRDLARSLLGFLEAESVVVVPPKRSRMERAVAGLSAWLRRHLTPVRWKAVAVGGLGALGIWAVWSLVTLLLAVRDPLYLETKLAELVVTGRVAGRAELFWFGVRLTAEGIVGLMLLSSAILLLAGREQEALYVGALGLTFALAVVDLLVFYFEQFSTIVTAGVQLTLLQVLEAYRRRRGEPVRARRP